ncbi:MAG: arginase family protein [archaeon]
MEPWKLISLETDIPGEYIGEYFEKKGYNITRVENLFGDILYDKEDICEFFDKKLGHIDRRKLVLYGSGSYHHYTYGLCKRADKISNNYLYIHFDHHTDYTSVMYEKDYISMKHGRPTRSRLSCGSFVDQILTDTNASALFFVGSIPRNEDKDLHLGIRESTLESEEGPAVLKKQISSLPNEVYLSFDLDVMHISEIKTDYNQGIMTTELLLKTVEIIKENKNIIGADILGLSKEEFKGLWLSRTRNKGHSKGLKLYKKLVDLLITS